jgi:lysophospholipase L1-like esterase
LPALFRPSAVTALALLAACAAAPGREPVPVPTHEPPTVSPPKGACGPMRGPVTESSLTPVSAPNDPAPVAIVRPEALDGFYDALAKLAHGRASDSVRIAVFGDSNLTMDFTSGRMRRRLQQRFGDAGHGFVALGKPWSHYRHMDVQHDVLGGWKAFAITTSPTGDGMYGLGGIAAENQFIGARTFAATAPAGAPVGGAVSRFDLFYFARPKGGEVAVRIDERSPERLRTQADEPGLGVRRFEVADGPHRIEVSATSNGSVRLFGVALERSEPGVVVDSFGVGALNTKTLGRHDPSLFAAMLTARRYDLVVFMTGANDIFTMDAVPPTMKRIIATIRQALPRASILMMTPADRGLKKSMKETLAVVAQRHEVAANEGVALWDQFAAMGGQSSMGGFVDAKLAFKDAVHFTEIGGAFVGDRFIDALYQGFDAFVAKHPEAGCP